MESIFDSLGTALYTTNGHKGYLLQWKFVSPLCKMWSRNREPDMERVKEMVAYHHKGGYIPRMIHLAELKDEGIVCYDGNHRKEVFNRCTDDESLQCIVDVMFDATQKDVFMAFNHINKSVQLPAMYIDECEPTNESTVTADIMRLVKAYETKYKPFLSTSARCHAPHFNRDTLTDNLYTIYKSFHPPLPMEQIATLLEKLNGEYANGRLCRSHTSYKPSLLEKCKKHNMWLFIEKTIPVDHVERMLHPQ